MRIAFFGTPAFAVPTLEALLASSHRVVAVVTQPDRPSGRGQHLAEPPVKVVARRAGIPVSQPERLKNEEWLQAFRELATDIAVVAAYGKILPQVLIDVPPHGFLNVHASLLPSYRGASPIQHAVMNGDAETGITIMRIVLALDAGPMLAQGRLPVGPDDTSEDVEHALAGIGASLMIDTLNAIEAGTANEVAQDETGATFASRLSKEEGLLDWRLDAHSIHNRVRGLRPWPQAFSFLDGKRITIRRGRVGSTDAFPRDAAPGTILHAHGDTLIVAAGAETAYQILDLQPEGRRLMTAREFLAGHATGPGARFSGPS